MTHEDLAQELRQRLAARTSDSTYWLGIAGAPGSGKSTLSQAIVDFFGSGATRIPMDGYHFYRAELDAMPDPAEAHRRRGAPFTFNAERFVAELAAARRDDCGSFPSFDHQQRDPVENDIHFDADVHGLVVVEGNYLLLAESPWNRLPSIFHETWFLDVPLNVCMARVKQRFLDMGLDDLAAQARIETNDQLNAELVIRTGRARADRIVRFD